MRKRLVLVDLVCMTIHTTKIPNEEFPHYVYKITLLNSGAFYYGKRTWFKGDKYTGSSSILKNSSYTDKLDKGKYSKYRDEFNSGNYSFEIIEIFNNTKDEEYLEVELIDRYLFKDLLNLNRRRGGDGKPWSETRKQWMTEKWGSPMGQCFTNEAREKCSLTNLKNYGKRNGALSTEEVMKKSIETRNKIYGNPWGAAHTKDSMDKERSTKQSINYSNYPYLLEEVKVIKNNEVILKDTFYNVLVEIYGLRYALMNKDKIFNRLEGKTKRLKLEFRDKCNKFIDSTVHWVNK